MISSRVLLAATLGLTQLMLLLACSFHTSEYMGQLAPNAKYSGAITKYYVLGNGGYPKYRFDLLSSRGHYTLGNPEMHGLWSMRFAGIFWSDDSRYVGFLILNEVFPPKIEMAFDVSSGKQIPFETLYPAIRKEMKERWSCCLDPSKDPVESARNPTQELVHAFKWRKHR